MPTWAAITPDGRYLAACFDNVQNATTFAIAVYSINASTGALTQVPNSPFTTIAQGNRLAFDPAGQWLAETTMNGLFIYKFDVGSGSLAVNSAVLGSGESDGLAFNKAGNLLFVTSKPANQLSVYKFNVGTGAATPAAGPYPTGQAPADIAIIQR